MPLTIELYGKNLNGTGHLIIDRNFLIFAYYIQNNNAHIHRNRMGRLIYTLENLFPQFKKSKKNFIGTDDPRHDVLEHMCTHDRNLCFHSHAQYEDDIGFNQIELMFSNLDISGYEDLISKKCIQDILNISKAYFSDPDRIPLEDEYRKEKLRNLDKVFDINKANIYPDKENANIKATFQTFKIMRRGNYCPFLISGRPTVKKSSQENHEQNESRCLIL